MIGKGSPFNNYFINEQRNVEERNFEFWNIWNNVSSANEGSVVSFPVMSFFLLNLLHLSPAWLKYGTIQTKYANSNRTRSEWEKWEKSAIIAKHITGCPIVYTLFPLHCKHWKFQLFSTSIFQVMHHRHPSSLKCNPVEYNGMAVRNPRAKRKRKRKARNFIPNCSFSRWLRSSLQWKL